jgi:LPPG:FO 2-phospho-L-lactate transferase
VRDAVAKKVVVAVSPIVGGKAVKGPLAEMLRAISNEEPGPLAISRYYAPLLSGIVVEEGEEAADFRMKPSRTVMLTREDSLRLARDVLGFVREVA